MIMVSIWRKTLVRLGACEDGLELFRGQKLVPRIDLTGANLSWADLSWADLSWADLSWADLSRANLFGANLFGADRSVSDTEVPGYSVDEGILVKR